MAINDGFYWYKNVLKKQLKLASRIYLSIAIVLAPIFLMSSATAGAAESWTIEEVKYNNVGKSLSYTASRPNAMAANDYVYKANVGVTAARTGSTVANMIRMGLAGAAIYGIVEGVGWIIDNGVVVKKPSSTNPAGTIKTISSIQYNCIATQLTPCINEYLSYRKLSDKQYRISIRLDSPTVKRYQVDVFSNGADGPTIIQEIFEVKLDTSIDEKPIPVSDTELGDAINNSPQAPSVLPDIYNPNNPAGGQAPQATDDALNNANPEPRSNPKKDIKPKPNKDTDDDGIPDVYDPSLPSQGFEFELPEFCSWAVTVCDWYIKYKEDVKKAEKHREDEQVVWTKEETHRTNEKEVWEEEKTHRTDEKTFWQKVEEFFDWTKDDSDLPEKEESPDIPDLSIDADEVNLSASNTCPQDSISFSVMGKSVTLDMPYQPVCDALNFFKPAVLLVGAVASVYIVAGVRTKEEDEV